MLAPTLGSRHIDGFIERAVEWPKEWEPRTRFRKSELNTRSKVVNPLGLEIGPQDQAELDALIEIHGEVLRRLGEDAGNLAAECVMDWYEHHCEHWLESEGRDPGHLEYRGGQWNFGAIMKYGGWVVPIRFYSLDYPGLESALLEIRDLQEIRNEEVLAFFRDLSR